VGARVVVWALQVIIVRQHRGCRGLRSLDGRDVVRRWSWCVTRCPDRRRSVLFDYAAFLWAEALIAISVVWFPFAGSWWNIAGRG